MSGELKDQPRASAAQVRAAETLFAIATDTTQTQFLAVTQAVMREVYGETATQENLYNIFKAIVLGNRTEDDTAHTLTIPTPEAFTQKTWVGNRRQTFTDITSTPTNNVHPILTLDITPSAANQLIRVRGVILASPISASPNNRRIAAFCRMKKGTGQYTDMNGGTSPRITYLGHSPDMNNYQDWGNSEISFEFLLTAADTDTLRINLMCKQFSGSSQDNSSNIYINRAVNNNYATKGSTWLEVTEYKESNSDTPIAITTVTTTDAP